VKVLTAAECEALDFYAAEFSHLTGCTWKVEATKRRALCRHGAAVELEQCAAVLRTDKIAALCALDAPIENYEGEPVSLAVAHERAVAWRAKQFASWPPE
jgi:hypothetical protein